MQIEETKPTKNSVALNFTEEFQTQRQDTLFNIILAFVFAITETIVVYLLLSFSYHIPLVESLIGRIPDAKLPWFVALMISRGFLQPINLCLFWFGVNFLIYRIWTIHIENKAFKQPFFESLPINKLGELIIRETDRTIPMENVKQIAKNYSGTLPLLVRRIEAGSRRLAEDGDVVQVQTVMHSIADIDREALESRYTLIRYLVWLIPTIGFLGTVIGIGRAISGFTEFMSKIGFTNSTFQIHMQTILGNIAGNLGIAFDTTILALLLSAIIVALMSVVQTREEGLLSNIDEFCLRFFVSRITVPDFSTKQTNEIIKNSIGLLAQILSNQDDKSTENDEHSFWRNWAGAMTAQTERLKELFNSVEKIRKAIDRRSDH